MEEAFNHFKEYTTNEEPHGYWIDGKVIYRKTIYFGSLPNNSHIDKPHGISNIDKIIKIEGIAYGGEYDYRRYIMLPLVYDSANTSYNAELSATDTHIRISIIGDRSDYEAYVTLYYTKTEVSA